MTMPAMPAPGSTGWDSPYMSALDTRVRSGLADAGHTHTGLTAASETAQGIVELATSAETITGTSNALAVHPAGLKAAQLLPPTTQSGTAYTFVLADGGPVVVEGNNASAITWTVPPNSSVAFPIGTQIFGRQIAAGQITVAAGAGVTVNGRGGALKSAGQWAEFVLTKRGTDLWVLAGDTST